MCNEEDARVDNTNTQLAFIRNVIAREFKESGLKQVSVSERTGIPPCQLSLILSGNRTIYADELVSLMVALDIPFRKGLTNELLQEYMGKKKGRTQA